MRIGLQGAVVQGTQGSARWRGGEGVRDVMVSFKRGGRLKIAPERRTSSLLDGCVEIFCCGMVSALLSM